MSEGTTTMALLPESIAARVFVCRAAAKQAAAKDLPDLMGLFSGQQKAYERIFVEMHENGFPEEMTSQEAMAELVDGMSDGFRSVVFQNAVTSCAAHAFVTLTPKGEIVEHECDENCTPANCYVAHHHGC